MVFTYRLQNYIRLQKNIFLIQVGDESNIFEDFQFKKNRKISYFFYIGDRLRAEKRGSTLFCERALREKGLRAKEKEKKRERELM